MTCNTVPRIPEPLRHGFAKRTEEEEPLVCCRQSAGAPEEMGGRVGMNLTPESPGGLGSPPGAEWG